MSILGRLNHVKPQMPLERIEVTIAVQQLMSVDDAESGNDRIDGFAHRHSALPQKTVVLRARNRNVVADHRLKLDRAQDSAHESDLMLRTNSLQNLGHNEVAYQ